MSYFGELKRRNVIRVAVAYLAATWLLTEVASTVFPLFGVPDWGTRFVVIILALGFVPTLIFSWVYELTPEGLKKEKNVVREGSITALTARRLDSITIAVVILALAIFFTDRFWLAPRTAEQLSTNQVIEPEQFGTVNTEVSDYPPGSIAVLPFVNMSDDESNEFFSEGISEELLNLLAGIPDLRVIARTSSFSFKGKDVKIADIARELNVAYVLEGSVRKSGENVRITAQLIRSADSSHLWSATYDRALENIFAIQDEIATAVVNELRVTLLGESTPQSTTTDPEAYALYLQGRHLNDRLTQESYKEAEQLLNAAISIDPEFAPAWRELGLAYWGQEGRERPVGEARKLAQVAFERALEIDPEYAPVYGSLGLLYRSNFDYSTADEYLQNALQLEDSSGFPYGAAASLSRTFGRFEQSIELAKKSISYDPVDSQSYANLGYSCYYANLLDEAAAAFNMAISLNPENFRSYVYLGRVLLAQGLAEEALDVIKMSSWKPYQLAGLAMAHFVLGNNAASSQALEELTGNWSETMAFQIAEIHAFRGNDDAAFEWLDRAYDTRDAGLNVLLGDPVFDGLTSDERYHLLVEKLGLSQYFQAVNRAHLGN